MAEYSQKYERIWAVVREVPYGHVATYGQIARLAGLGQRARMVGYALNISTEEMKLPWFRIINSGGRISLPKEDGRYYLQRSLLEAEGIKFHGDRISLTTYQWKV